ncbi:serine-rich adhesin for platelets-like [Ptychodera flava]|uniref:serine-rich adhesin for platelets-like n=1 Tax=Ptychodera flava TaxID=63121 RepID=UPI00396A8C02
MFRRRGGSSPDINIDTGSGQRKMVKELAALLRHSGNKILHGSGKLSLTTNSLTYLNDYFNDISDGVQSKTQDSNQSADDGNFYQDIQFLYQFIQQTKSLKVMHGTSTIQGTVNICHCEKLHTLEIKRVPLHLLTGLQALRTHLKVLVCTRCVQTLEELFSSCGGDKSSSQAWPELHTVCLSFNQITKLDDSLKLLTAIHVLDLSHNSISDVSYYLEYLSELTHLNLGYNQLERIPSLSIRAKTKLQSLVLRNNKLENLQGLEQFRNLQELDVANNCIVEVVQLIYLSMCHLMTRLILQGNPLCFHPSYRIIVVKNLSPAVITQKVYLDGKRLSNAELKYVPKGDLYKLRTAATMFEASVNSTDSYWLDSGAHPSSCTSVLTDDDTDPLVHHMAKSGSKGKSLKGKRSSSKKSKHRQPDIDEPTSDKSQPSSRASTPYIDGSDIQQRVETIREQLGPDWLVGLSAKPETHYPAENGGKAETKAEVREIQTVEGDVTDAPTPEGACELEEDEFVIHHENPPKINELDDIGRPRILSATSDDGIVGVPFIVTALGKNTSDNREILLTTNERSIQERNLDGQIIEKLDIKSIQTVKTSFQVIADAVGDKQNCVPVVSLTFNYIRRDRQRRDYVMEDEDNAKALVELFAPILEQNQTLPEALQKLQCMKCSSVFPKNQAHKKIQRCKTPSQLNTLSDDEMMGSSPEFDSLQEISVCPKCGSELLVEIEQPAANDSHQSTPVGSYGSMHSAQPLATSSPWKLSKNNSFTDSSMHRTSSSEYLTADSNSMTSPKTKQVIMDNETVSSTSTLTALSSQTDSETTIKAYSTDDIYSSQLKHMEKRNLELEFVENEIAKSEVFKEKEPVIEPATTSLEGDLYEFRTDKAVQELLEKGESRDSFTQRYSLVPADMLSSSDSDGSNTGKRSSSGSTSRNESRTNSPVKLQRFRELVPGATEDSFSKSGNCEYPPGFPKEPMESSVTTPIENVAFGRVPSELSSQGEATRHGAADFKSDSDVVVLPSPQQSWTSKQKKQDGVNRRSSEIIDSSSSDIAVLSNPSQSSITVLASPSSDVMPSIYDMHSSTVSADSSSGNSSSGVPRSISLNGSAVGRNTSAERLYSPESGIYDTNITTQAEMSPVYSEVNPSSAITPNMCASMVASIYERTLDSKSDDLLKQNQGEKSSSQKENDDLKYITPLSSLSSTPVTTTSIISNIFERSGSFPDSLDSQKTNLSDSKSGRSRNNASSAIQYNYDDFTVVDHRLKLHIMMTFFKLEDEDFECLLKVPVFQYSKQEQYQALLVVSSHIVYILKVTKEEKGTPADWLSKKAQHPIADLMYIDIGLCHQMFRLEFTNEGGCYTFLVRDLDRCQRFIECLSGIIHKNSSNKLKAVSQENKSTLSHIVSQIFTQQSDEGLIETDTSVSLYLHAYQQATNKQGEKCLSAITLVATPTDVCLAEENYLWPLPRLLTPSQAVLKTQQFTSKSNQKVSNISGIELYEDAPCHITILFFSEDTDDTRWDLVTETEASLNELITAIKDPWEKLFSVELQQIRHPTIEILDL